ncbi:hypothetical protein METP3_03505 [Methanosarcinales archaeon]|nr:hypothetical protein METP3_03505 [Methanosarcinales archaeon]
MKNISGKKLVFIALAVLAVCAIIIIAWFAPLQKSKYVHIGISVGTSQGAAENNTSMESIKVNGTFWNYGEITANSLTATVIFTDTAHNEVVRKTVKEGMDLPPNKGQIVEFYSEYSRERTIPKTEVNIMIEFDWMESGQLKTTLMPIKIASNY